MVFGIWIFPVPSCGGVHREEGNLMEVDGETCGEKKIMVDSLEDGSSVGVSVSDSSVVCILQNCWWEGVVNGVV